MKIFIGIDEIFPHYTLDGETGEEFDIPADVVAGWKKASDDFFQAQDEIELILDKAAARRKFGK